MERNYTRSQNGTNPETQKEIATLERRLSDFETGYYHGFGNRITEINIRVLGILADNNLTIQTELPRIQGAHDYIDAVYSEIDFQTLQRNQDTEHYFKTRTLYNLLNKALEELENPGKTQKASSNDNTQSTLRNIATLSSAILSMGSKPRYEIEFNVIPELNKRHKGKTYKLKKKVPKKFQTDETLHLAKA